MNRQEAFKVIMTLTLVIGGGFHPDHLIGDYVSGADNKQSYKEEDRQKWDKLLVKAKVVLGEDVYRVSMAFMSLYGEFKLRNDSHKLS